MTDINDDASFTAGNSGGSAEASGASKPEDQAALALKSSVLADAHDLTDVAKHLAGDAVNQVRESAQNQISGGKDRLADGLGSVAEAIRHTGEKLSEGEQSGLTDYVARAADGVEAASDYLKEKSISDVLGDVGTFARREPALFLGGAFVLGLLGGRFLKSSHVQPAPSNGGLGKSASGGKAKQYGEGHQNGPSGSRGKSGSRNLGSSSGTKPIAGERPREIGGVSGGYRSQDDGAKQPGAV